VPGPLSSHCRPGAYTESRPPMMPISTRGQPSAAHHSAFSQLLERPCRACRALVVALAECMGLQSFARRPIPNHVPGGRRCRSQGKQAPGTPRVFGSSPTIVWWLALPPIIVRPHLCCAGGPRPHAAPPHAIVDHSNRYVQQSHFAVPDAGNRGPR